LEKHVILPAMNTDTEQDTKKRLRWSFSILLLVLLALGMSVRIWGAWMFSASYSMDHSVPCLMTKHMAEGRDYPAFYYGQAYMGSLEPFVSTLFYRLPINHNLACNLGTALFGIALLPLLFLWGKKTGGRRAGVGAVAFLVIGPAVYMQFMNWSYGGYAAMTFLGAALLLSGLRILDLERVEKGSSSLWLWLLTGLLGGLGWWTSFLLIPFLLTLVILFLVILRLRCFRLNTLWALIAFGVGSAPFWIWNWTHNWKSFVFLMQDVGGADPLQGLKLCVSTLVGTIVDMRGSLIIAIVAVIYAAGMIYSAFVILRDREHRSRSLYMTAALLVFVITLFFFIRKPSRLGPSRYFLTLMPVLAVWLGVFVEVISKRLRYGLAWIPLLVLIAPQLRMLPVCHRWYEERHDYYAQLDELGAFFQREKIQTIYTLYEHRKLGYGLNFYYDEAFVFPDPDKERYVPYLQQAEGDRSPAVLGNPYELDRLFHASGGTATRDQLRDVRITHRFVPPGNALVPLADPVSMVDASTGAEFESSLNDDNIYTCWINDRERKNNTIFVTWNQPETICTMRIIARKGKWPEQVSMKYASPERDEWISLPDYFFSPWFWSGERAFFGGEFYRQELRFPDITTRKMKITFNGDNYNDPVYLAELQFFTESKNEKGTPDKNFDRLCHILQERSVQFVFCDRGLGSRLLRDGPEGLSLSLDKVIYPDEERRLSSSMVLTPATVLVVEPRDASYCSGLFDTLGIDYEIESIGGWSLFFFDKHDLGSVSGHPLPLRWMGFSPIVSNEGVWRKKMSEKAQQLLRDDNISSAKKTINLILQFSPDYVPALRVLAAIKSDTGKESEAKEILQRVKALSEPQHAFNVDFKNGMELCGTSVSATVARGETLACAYFWKMPSTIDVTGLAVFVHLKDADGKVCIQDDHILSDIGPNSVETFNHQFIEYRQVPIPKDLPTGSYTIDIGLYQSSPPHKRIRITNTTLKGRFNRAQLPVSVHITDKKSE